MTLIAALVVTKVFASVPRAVLLANNGKLLLPINNATQAGENIYGGQTELVTNQGNYHGENVVDNLGLVRIMTEMYENESHRMDENRIPRIG